MTRLPDRSEYLHSRTERVDNAPIFAEGHPIGDMSVNGAGWNRADPLPEPPEGSVEALILELRRTPMAETGLDPDDNWR